MAMPDPQRPVADQVGGALAAEGREAGVAGRRLRWRYWGGTGGV